MFNESKIISSNNEMDSRPKKLRIVDFKKDDHKEKSPITTMLYGKFLENTARKMGCIEKHGRIVNPHTKEISDGNLCEEAILGKCAIKRWEMIPVPTSNLNPIVRKKAEKVLFGFIRNHQPENDNSETITHIKKLIQEKIEPIAKSYGQKIGQVSFCTAVGSPLDYHYGIDGWIEIQTTNGRTEKITFDLKSGNSKKAAHGCQADLLLKMDDHKIKSMPRETLEQLFRFVDKVSEMYEGRLKR